MNYIGREVTHNKYGKGKIISQDNEYISVHFSSVNLTKRFNYPECFKKYLSLAKTIRPKTEDTDNEVGKNGMIRSCSPGKKTGKIRTCLRCLCFCGVCHIMVSKYGEKTEHFQKVSFFRICIWN